MSLRTALFAVLSLALAAAPLQAQEGATRRLRGTIASVDGTLFEIKENDGGTVSLRLRDGGRIMLATKASLADVKPGSYVGIANQVGADGKQDAVEVHIFPEAMRGSGEGQRPWDLGKSSKMTNGAVGTKVMAVDGQNLQLTYRGGESTIQVRPSTPVVSFGPGSVADLKVGAHVFIREAQKSSDGVLQAAAIVVGKDGLTPAL